MNNKKASYWKYTGNHPSGNDCERCDPHGFGLAVIGYLASVGEGSDYREPLTYSDSETIRVTHCRGDDFGHEVIVSAPLDIWERAKQALPKTQAAL